MLKYVKKFESTFHSKLNSFAIKHLIKTELQLKNYFKLIILESMENNMNVENGMGQFGIATIGSIIGTVISVLYLKSFSINGVNIVYEGNMEKYARDIKSPESVTMSFIDDSKGVVRRYLIAWLKQSAIVSYNKASKSDDSYAQKGFKKTFVAQDNVSYVFADNQLAAKKTGILLLGNTVGKLIDPLNFPRTMLYGLRPHSVGELSGSQEDGTVMTYDVTFAVDEVATPLI